MPPRVVFTLNSMTSPQSSSFPGKVFVASPPRNRGLSGRTPAMIEEPYRWLDAISNRREYIRDQLKGGTPVFAVSRKEGILLLGVGQGQSKVFEIYDRHGLAALGHPVDIEKLRQAAIEAAHLEGFNRSAGDVTLRRLISFA